MLISGTDLPSVKSTILSRLVHREKDSAYRRTPDGACVATSIGEVRSANQDRVAFINFASNERTDRIGIICDGMGGLEAGDLAASEAIACFITGYLAAYSGYPEARLRAAVFHANKEVSTRFSGRSGTTLTAMLDTGSSDFYIVSVGDSRAYSVRSDATIEQITTDDTLSGVMNRPDQHTNRLLQFVGMDDELEFSASTFKKNGLTGVLLSTDGAHVLAPGLLNKVYSAGKDGADACRRIIIVANALGGRDNSSLAFFPFSSATSKSTSRSDQISIEVVTPSQEIIVSLLSRQSGGSAGWRESEASQYPRQEKAEPKLVKPKVRKASTAKSKKKPIKDDIDQPSLIEDTDPSVTAPRVGISFPKSDEK